MKKVIGKIILAIATVVLTAELLAAGSHVANYLNRGFTLGQAIEWEWHETMAPWAKIFEKEETVTSYPMANQHIEWNWQAMEEHL